MGKKIRERIKYWLQILLLPIYWFSFLFPRNKKIWAFGSTFGTRFADNPRYYYLYLNQKEKEIRPIWISKEKEIVNLLMKEGYEAYLQNTPKAVFFALRAGVYFYDNYPKDISHWLSGGAIKVNMWHGLPLKKIQMDNKKDFIRNPRNIWERFYAVPRRLSDEKSSHYVLCTSETFAPIFSSAFATKKILVAGYPRCDFFMSQQFSNLLLEEEKTVLYKIKNGSYKKMILYMPTFRESETKFFDYIELKELQHFLRENEYMLCIKLHCKSKLNEQFKKIECKEILIIDAKVDPYSFIEYSDMLLTDYSSIYFDYLLTNKPILFFPYDYEEYLSKERDMYFDYQAILPGYRCENGGELQRKIKFLLEGKEEESIKKKRTQIKEMAFLLSEDLACEKITKKMQNVIQREVI